MALDDQLTALATMSPAQLRAEWRRVQRTPPPRLGGDLLARAIAYRIQERRHGSLSPAIVRTLDRLARQSGNNGAVDEKSAINLKSGTKLIREWHGRTFQVLVGEDGFMFEDRHYQSLTQIARAITGVAWSGPRFFGLKRRTSASVRRIGNG